MTVRNVITLQSSEFDFIFCCNLIRSMTMLSFEADKTNSVVFFTLFVNVNHMHEHVHVARSENIDRSDYVARKFVRRKLVLALSTIFKQLVKRCQFQKDDQKDVLPSPRSI